MLKRDELIDVVASDLEFLKSDWDESVDDHSLRRSSPVLRRLLVDNELQRAWKVAGFEREPQVTAATLAPLLAEVPKEKVTFASAGGATYGKVRLQSLTTFRGRMSHEDIKRWSAEGVRQADLGLSAFIESPCLVIYGHEVPRRVLIKFVANKLGGAHFDQRRRQSKEERLFTLLDKASAGVTLAGKNAVYFELLSIGQALVSSRDVNTFLEAVR